MYLTDKNNFGLKLLSAPYLTTPLRMHAITHGQKCFRWFCWRGVAYRSIPDSYRKNKNTNAKDHKERNRGSLARLTPTLARLTPRGPLALLTPSHCGPPPKLTPYRTLGHASIPGT